jgi:PAS domain S-box-containing protein
MELDKEQYYQLFQAVLHSSEALISNKSEQEAINDVLSVLGVAAAVDRVYIFRNSFENGEYAYLHYDYEWVKEGIEPQIGSGLLDALPWSEFSWLKDTLISGASYMVVVNELEPGEFRETLELQDIKSVLFTPIIFDEKLWGFIGFDDCTHFRKWLDIEVTTLLAISANIGSFLKRNALATELSKQYLVMNNQKEFYETIFNNIPADIVAFNKDHKYMFLNHHAVKNKEVREWMIGKDDFEYCEWRQKPIELAILRRSQFDEMLATKEPHKFEEKMISADGKPSFHLRVMHPVLNESNDLEIAIGYGVDVTTIKNQEVVIARQNEAIINSPDGIALLDNLGNYYYMNPAHESIFGYGENGLIGKNWQVLYKPEEAEFLIKTVFPILAETGIWNGQVQAYTKMGKIVYQDLTLRQLADGSLVCITRDVSDLLHNVRLLKEANQKLALAINSTQLGFYEWNIVKDELVGNEIFNKILGFKTSEKHTHAAADWFNRIHVDDVYLVKDAHKKQKRLLQNADVTNYSIEYRIKGANNEYIWVLDVGKVSHFDEHGESQFMLGFIVDISANKINEEKIRVSEKRNRDLVENLREVIFETDNEANFIFLNPAWYKLTGFSIAESLGKTFADFYHPENLNLENALNKSDIVNPSKTYLHGEMCLQHKNGQLIWFDIEINKLLDAQTGKLKTAVGSIEDITKRKLAENELKQALAKEKQLGDLKSRFVTMASHEFRTPLAGIRSSAELISMLLNKLAELLPEKPYNSIANKIENIIFDVDRITGLMTDVLTMGGIESAKIPFNATLGDLTDFTETYLNKEAKRYLNGQSLKFNNLTSKQVQVLFDPKLVIHVFNNMISNAAKYAAPNTEILVQVKCKNNFLQIQFIDQGIGIPAKELPFIFDSFFRSSNVENIPGTGLGLSIAKYFMDLHHGIIELESEVNIGTTVILSFPLEKNAV